MIPQQATLTTRKKFAKPNKELSENKTKSSVCPKSSFFISPERFKPTVSEYQFQPWIYSATQHPIYKRQRATDSNQYPHPHPSNTKNHQRLHGMQRNRSLEEMVSKSQSVKQKWQLKVIQFVFLALMTYVQYLLR